MNKALARQLMHALRASPSAQDEFRKILRESTDRSRESREYLDRYSRHLQEIGPRSAGGMYWSDYWKEGYVVLDIVFPDSGGWEVVVLWTGDSNWSNRSSEPPRISRHCTPWLWTKDKIISQPIDYRLEWEPEG